MSIVRAWRGCAFVFPILGLLVACGADPGEELMGDEPSAMGGESADGDLDLAGAGGFITRRGANFFEGAKVWRPIGVTYAYPMYSQPFYQDPKNDWVTLWDDPNHPEIHAKEQFESDFALMQAKGINEFRLYVPQAFVANSYDPAAYPTKERSYCARINQVLDMAGKHGLHMTMVLPFNRNGSISTWGTYAVAASQSAAETFLAYPLKVIDACGLANRREILAYQIDAEGEVESPLPKKRLERGEPHAVALWNEWLTERYGSVAKAEARLATRLPRECTGPAAGVNGCPDLEEWDAGCTSHSARVCPPRLETKAEAPETPRWLSDSSANRAFVRFTDWVMNKRFQRIRDILTQHDSRHLLAQDSLLQDGYWAYDMYLRREQTKYLDFAGVHVYHDLYPFQGKLTPWNRATFGEGGQFDNYKSSAAAIAWMNPERRPVMIGEAGVSVLPCKGDGFCIQGNQADREAVQKELLKFEMDVFASGGASGYRWWWWRGNRPMSSRDPDTSDCGILSPDGKGRSILDAFASSKATYDTIASSPVVNYTFDAAKASTIFILDKASRAAATAAVDAKKVFRARTQCSGKDSRTAPTEGIDSKPYFSGCSAADAEHCTPLVCLDAMFETIEVLDANGKWADARDGKTVTVAKGTPVKMRVSVGNTGESAWAANVNGDGVAKIAISGTDVTTARASIPETVASFDSTTVVEFSPIASITKAGTVNLKMVAEKRAYFGETVSVSLNVK